MRGALLRSGLAPLARRAAIQTARRYTQKSGLQSSGAGLLRVDSLRTSLHRSWPPGSSAIHNVPAVRNISFVRNVPSLFMKLLRIPAMFGGAAVAGLAYIQYQANRM